jgi:hypothetical protein
VLARQRHSRCRIGCSAAGVMAQQLEQPLPYLRLDQGRDVADGLSAGDRVVLEPCRTIDLAERPDRSGEIVQVGNADVLAEAVGEIAVALGNERGKRPFDAWLGASEIAVPQAG